MDELPPLDPPAAAGESDPPYWGTQRKELAAWFAENGPHLGELYRSAVNHIEDRTAPGRAVLVAHCVREIVNRLPAAAKLSKTTRMTDSARISKLIKLWRELQLPDDLSLPPPIEREASSGAGPDGEGPNSGPPSVAIPVPLAEDLIDLLREHADQDGRRLARATELLRELSAVAPLTDDQLRQLASRWVEALKWFQKKVHLPEEYRPVSEEDLVRHFATVEGVMCSMLRPFFSGLKEVDDFLEKANS